MSSPVIDVHAHAFPALSSFTQGMLPDSSIFETLKHARRSARSWLRPLSESFHKTQTLLRHFPDPIRQSLDQLAGVAPVATLLVESTVEDLLEAMELHEIDQALLIAHPPVISNEFVLETCQHEPRLLPVVNISKDTPKPKTALKNFAKKGARALKIHTAADGERVTSDHYHELLKAAQELGLFVILHTGCIHSNLIYKKPDASRAELFTPWFDEFKELTFVLAHMNFHEPQTAMNLVLEYPNVHIDTSWQPAEIIAEAVRRVGSDRIMFGSDWPLLGNNITVGLNRIEDCVETGLITQEDAKRILGENAVRLLKL
jgi:predicted TIM-barrel fold metal-dependent hydrolase